MTTPTINFTPALLAKLKEQHAEAVKLGSKAFTFEGRILLVSYAKYLIEHLDNKFKEGPNQ